MQRDDFASVIGADRRFQERLWFWERVGWAAMALLVLAALAGLTGTRGPAASGTVEAGGATIEYPRISRWQSADSLGVEFAVEAGGAVQVLLPGAFTDVFSIQSVTPQPSKVTATANGQLFEFELAPEPGPKKATFAVRAERPAFPVPTRGEVGGAPFAFSFTVLP